MHDEFVVFYAGRVGVGTSIAIITIAKAIEFLNCEGYNIKLQIQVPSLPDNIKYRLKPFKNTQINKYIDYYDLPSKLSSVDLLVLPMDFDKKNLSYIHLSMPTKVPEYMASGTPILVFADKTTALANYASSENWAFVVTENSIISLIDQIKYIFKNKLERMEKAHHALQIVQKYHSGELIRESFRNYFLQVLK
ncbi:MAG: glycosyltransferase family 4 protein [Chloroflexia bacterium]|nr:glycosyltransferase family 4 protein [Chloroflexia bacterium]